VDLYRPAADPVHPDMSGRRDLDFGVVVHLDVPAGEHTLRIDVLNNSGVATRNMVYIDGFAIYNGDASGLPSSPTNTSNEVTDLLNGLIGAEYTIISTANTVNMDTILAAAPSVAVTVKDPTGAVVASGTVEDGVLALQFGPNSIGAYTIDAGDPTGGQVDIDLWEVVESR